MAKLFGIITVKDETKIKLQAGWAKAKRNIPWVVGVGLYGWTLSGLVKAHEDHKELKRVKHDMDELTDVVTYNAQVNNYNARLSQDVKNRVIELERQNKELLDKAIQDTMGEKAG